MNVREQAEELAMALTLGFATVEEAVRWADAEIAARDVIPPALIEVSCGGSLPPLEVAHLLRMIPGDCDVRRASRGVIRRMAVEFDTWCSNEVWPVSQVEHTVRALYTMSLLGWTPDEQADWQMCTFDDMLYDRQIDGTVPGLIGELRDFFRQQRRD